MKLTLWIWLIPLAFLWPLIHLLVFILRYGALPSSGVSTVFVFILMSLVAAIVLLLLWERSPTRACKIGIILGYLLGSPVAFAGSLLGGLAYPPLIGATFYGAPPLIIGMVFGYFFARILRV